MSSVTHRAKQRFLKNNNATCLYCGKTCDQKELWVDHIIPKSRGGPDKPSNLVPCCKRCNLLKRDLSLEDFATKVENLKADLSERIDYLTQVSVELFGIREDMEVRGKWAADSQH